jgi:hypothetical protein
MKKIFIVLLLGVISITGFSQLYIYKPFAQYSATYVTANKTYIDNLVSSFHDGTLINYNGVQLYRRNSAWVSLEDSSVYSANSALLQGHAASYFSVKTNTDSLNLIDTFYFSSANIIAGDSVQLYSATTGTNRRIINNIVIDYRYNSPVYASTGADSIFICAKYKSTKVKLIYIADSYITDAYSGYGCLMPTLGKLDANTVFWIKIPHIYSNGKGVLRLRLSSKIVKF